MTAVGRLIHADWSVHTKKRWAAFATLTSDGGYVVEQIARFVSSPADLISEGERHGLLIGFDFPIGLPRTYAETINVNRFPDFLKRLGSDPLFAEFARSAETAAEISAYRPFYPARPGGTSRDQLVRAHGVVAFDELLRECERRTPTRPAACSLFWTLGGNQVGRAATAGWLEALAPLSLKNTPRFWPFDGSIQDLTAEKRVTVVETYPAEAMRFIGVSDGRKFSKRRQTDRASVSRRIFDAAGAIGVTLSDQVSSAVKDGFGNDKEGEDRFDALIGLLGMASVLLDRHPEGVPADARTRLVEGWILGQSNASNQSVQ